MERFKIKLTQTIINKNFVCLSRLRIHDQKSNIILLDCPREILGFYIKELLNDFMLISNDYDSFSGRLCVRISSMQGVGKVFKLKISSSSMHLEKSTSEVKEYFNQISNFLDEIESFCSNESREEVITSFLI